MTSKRSQRRATICIAGVMISLVAPRASRAIQPAEILKAPDLRKSEFVLPGTDEAQMITYEIRNGYAVFQGDMILGRVDSFGDIIPRDDPSKDSQGPSPKGVVIDNTFWSNYRWPGAVVPYVISDTITLAGRKNISRAMSHWSENVPGIRFVQWSGERDFVFFVRGDDPGVCSSYVGRIGGGQALNLDTDGDCDTFTLVHEIGHALGLYHEQSREDRDQHITINWQNIIDGRAPQFDKMIDGASDYGKYDFYSIMHYGMFDFSKNGLPTIVPKQGKLIGNRTETSDRDAAVIRSLYNLELPRPRLNKAVQASIAYYFAQ